MNAQIALTCTAAIGSEAIRAIMVRTKGPKVRKATAQKMECLTSH